MENACTSMKLYVSTRPCQETKEHLRQEQATAHVGQRPTRPRACTSLPFPLDLCSPKGLKGACVKSNTRHSPGSGPAKASRLHKPFHPFPLQKKSSRYEQAAGTARHNRPADLCLHEPSSAQPQRADPPC